MDAKGAKLVTQRLAERQWQLAPSVLRGEQPPEDPDAQHLESIGNDYRLHALPDERDGDAPRRVKKVLVDRSWQLDDADDLDSHAAA